jgi:GT2 family glycosyltransferase
MGAARNHGWRCAAGAIVGFTTDQVIPAPGWIDGAVQTFDPVVDVVGGQVVVPLPARPSLPARRTAEHIQSPWTAHNVFYRRRLLQELDGFDEAYSSRGHDDTDLILAAISAGARFCAAESAVVVHTHAKPTWREELSRQVLHADEARLYRKHPRLYAQYVRPSPLLTEYLALAALAGTMLGALTRRAALTWTTAALWAGVTAVRFQRTGRGASTSPRDATMLLLVASALPPVVVALRLYGAAKHRVWFF